MQLPADSRRLCPSPKEGAASASSLDPLLLLEGAGDCRPTLKKLLHLRALFETPLMQVFGFPFVLRHQLPAAVCCACCSSCCCCCSAAIVTPHVVCSQRTVVSTTASTAAAAADCCAAAGAAVNPIMSSSSSSSTTAAVAAGTASALYGGPLTAAAVAAARPDTAVTRSYASMIPCSATECCSCCKGGANATRAAARQRLTQTQESPWSSTDSSRNSSSSSHTHQQTGDRDSSSSTRRNRKRLRLVGEDTVAAVVASAVSTYKHTRSTRAQDERAVEIFISRNILRQIKLPIDTGSYVLFFTADWLQYLECYVHAAQREALLFSSQHRCCPTCGGGIATNNQDTSVAENSITGSCSMTSRSSESSTYRTFAHVSERKTFRCSCGDTAETVANKSSAVSSSRKTFAAKYNPNSTSATEDNICSSRCAADTHETTAPLRFTPVLRQDDVQTADSCGGCDNDTSRSRKKVLLNLPERLGQQLKDVLLLQLLKVHTQTQIDKRIVEDVLRSYLRAWHQRRHDAALILRELLQRAEELLQEVTKGVAVCSGKQPQQHHQETVGRRETISPEETRHTQVPARDAATRKHEARDISEQAGAKVLKVEEASTVRVERETSQIRRDARRNEKPINRNDNADTTNIEGQERPAYVQGAHGGVTRNCHGDIVSVKNARGGAITTYICKREQVNVEDRTDTELPKDLKESHKTQQHGSALNAERSTALMKQLINMQNLLQRGCEAAAEVFSLQENAAAGAALRVEETTFQKPKTEAESHEGAYTQDSERQHKEEHGRKVVRIKKETDEEAGVGTENTGTKKRKEGEQSCGLHSRSGIEELRHPCRSDAHSAAASLKEKIRCAAAAAQLLTEGEKTLLAKTIPRAGLSSAAQAKSCSSLNCPLGTTRDAAPSAAPSRFHASESSCTSALDATRAARSCEDRTSTWQHQTLRAGRGKGGKNLHEEEQQPYVTFESLLQQQVEEILLLLYQAPLLCSRAGSNAVSLAVPQQGLLVRWLRDGRKEVLSSIKRRRFKEVLWVDIERRGLLKSGLGSRMTLLDLKGIGEVESTEIAAGEVVRLAERTEN